MTSRPGPATSSRTTGVGQVLAPRGAAHRQRGRAGALCRALSEPFRALPPPTSSPAACGLPRSPIEDLAAFHVVFGKTVPDVSLNAVANLGYAEARFLRAGLARRHADRATSEVIGLRETSNRQSGVVWVRSTGWNQHGEAVMRFCRWVMVRKRDPAAAAPAAVVPELAPAVAAADLVVPAGARLHRATTSRWPASPGGWGDYAVGERIDHVDRVTIEEAEHMLATRLWQNTAKVHFDVTQRDGRPAADLRRPRHQPGAGAELQRPRQRSGRRGDQRRGACQPLLRRRHRRRLVGGARQGRDRRRRGSARCACAPWR